MEEATASDAFGRLLRGERDRALVQLEARAAEYKAVSASSMTEGRDDEHDPDGSTPAVEHALAYGLLQAAEAYLADVDRALERLAAGTYGRCPRCGSMIPAERLEVRPTAAACVRCPV